MALSGTLAAEAASSSEEESSDDGGGAGADAPAAAAANTELTGATNQASLADCVDALEKDAESGPTMVGLCFIMHKESTVTAGAAGTDAAKQKHGLESGLVVHAYMF